MTLGEKIKSLRIAKKLKQSEVSGTKITRNMLSRIECDKANPSLDTLKYIAAKLGVSLSYLFSDYDDHFIYEKAAISDEIYEAFKYKSYKSCISLIEGLGKLDEELCLILTISHFELGKSLILKGSLISAKNHLETATIYADKSLFPLNRIKSLIPMYMSIALNIQSPLLEFDTSLYLNGLTDGFDFELYKYITLDTDYKYIDETMSMHMKAKLLMRERDYNGAIELLVSAAELNNKKIYNAVVIFSLYSDLEICYKELMDFENAYKYSTKRLSLLEGFKT